MKVSKYCIFQLFLFFFFSASNAQTWNLIGNSGTNSSTDFVGTSDNVDLIFKRNNKISGQIKNYITSFGYQTSISGGGTYNSVFGANSMTYATGGYNTVVGGNSYPGTQSFPTLGSFNCVLGNSSLQNNTSGNGNVAIGRGVLNGNSGNGNIGIGYVALNASVGDSNIAIGDQAGYYKTTGNGNIFIGYRSGPQSSSPISNQLFIEQVSTYLSTPLIWGDFNSRVLKFNVRRDINSRLEIDGLVNNSGIRLLGLPNTSTSVANTTNKVLSVNSFGDVILVDDLQGGVTSSCSTANFLPLFSSTSNNLTCSQIFDDGTTVGIGSTSGFNWTTTPSFVGSLGSIPSSGTLKLDVNGIVRVSSIFATSDQNFKKEIKSIENSLEFVKKLEGKTYLWDREKNKELNFDNGLHSGFIAQELEKVLPHLVITGEDGRKAVNYIEIIPYLVEAIKDQQQQINDLKSQLTESFLSNNEELIQFFNTKIISVSPNPSKDNISIAFNIDKNVKSASLQVHDLNGTIMSILNVKERDLNLNRTIQRENFGKGIYIVSLVINGKSIDTKKIIFE